MYELTIQTDWDFSIEYNGELYTDYDFTFILPNAEALNDIKILGPYGKPLTTSTKFSEIARAFHIIKQTPDEEYYSLGGNRGVYWRKI